MQRRKVNNPRLTTSLIPIEKPDIISSQFGRRQKKPLDQEMIDNDSIQLLEFNCQKLSFFFYAFSTIDLIHASPCSNLQKSNSINSFVKSKLAVVPPSKNTGNIKSLCWLNTCQVRADTHITTAVTCLPPIPTVFWRICICGFAYVNIHS